LNAPNGATCRGDEHLQFVEEIAQKLDAASRRAIVFQFHIAGLHLSSSSSSSSSSSTTTTDRIF